MDKALAKITYPHITYRQDIANGSPVIEGTRITVKCIAEYYQMGMNVDEILINLSHLTSAQVHSALAYYFDHQKEIDSDMKESSNIAFWKKQVGRNSVKRKARA
jgi:uncharacterized protein (DUF433 family)